MGACRGIRITVPDPKKDRIREKNEIIFAQG
jgi:hypothetical protein